VFVTGSPSGQIDLARCVMCGVGARPANLIRHTDGVAYADNPEGYRQQLEVWPEGSKTSSSVSTLACHW